jgi:ATP-binding cassette subfamily E protein 1
LDIEQRLVLNQKIRRLSEKREITTLVVDHDIIFIDAIANRLMVFEGESGKHGKAGPPGDKEEKMNQFLKLLNITFRRDPDTKRPRINKPGSQKDIEQKKEGKYYYA